MGSGSAASCTEAALDAALAAGGTITFNCGSNPVTIRLNVGKRVLVPATMDGGGRVTLDAQNRVRHFYVNAAYKDGGVPFTLRNITLINGLSSATDPGAGGCMYNRASKTLLENVTLRNCNAASLGGGISNYLGELTLRNVTIENSKARDGGAIADLTGGGTVNIIGGRYAANVSDGGNGGAVFVIDGTLNITGATFEANRTTANVHLVGIGAAVYTDKLPTIANISNTRFINNQGYEGGALFADRGTTLTLVDSEFTGNKATTRGGALGSYESVVKVYNTTFRNNEAFEGGGIYTSSLNNVTELYNLTVVGNRAGRDGGGIYHAKGKFLMVDSIVADNAAGVALGGDTRGGGIVIYDGSNTITSSTFSNNRVEGTGAYGGGIASNGTTEVINTTVVGNRSSRGGGIYINRATLRLLNVTVANNTANNGRSFARGSNGTVRVKNSILSSSGGSNCTYAAGTFFDDGGNLQFGDTTCMPSRAAVDPRLSTLGDFGGRTQTMALQPGSPAIDIGRATCPTVDQRGLSRSGACDSGAFEVATINPNLKPAIWIPLIRR